LTKAAPLLPQKDSWMSCGLQDSPSQLGAAGIMGGRRGRRILLCRRRQKMMLFRG